MPLTKEQEAIVAAGFKPPALEFHRQDPRGYEYGKHVVICHGPEDAIEVTHYSANEPEHIIRRARYTMRFDTLPDFLEWAKDHA